MKHHAETDKKQGAADPDGLIPAKNWAKRISCKIEDIDFVNWNPSYFT